MSSMSRLVCFLLLWSLTVVASAETTTESPLKQSIVKAKDISDGSLGEIKLFLAVIQTKIEKLIQASNTNTDQSEACISAMKKLTISYSSIDDRLKSLHMEFEKHNVFEGRTIQLRDIIADIRSHRFLLADEKLIQLADIVQIRKVIHEVYARSVDNLELVLNFATVSKPSHCLATLRALYTEVSRNDQNKTLNLIRIARTIGKEALDCNSNDNSLRLEIVSQIEVTAVEILITSMKAGNFSSSEYVRLLLDELYDFSPIEFDIVMKRLIDQAYGVVDPQVILDNIFIRFNNAQAQAISGIGNLVLKIKEGGYFNKSDLTIDIASKLSDLRNRKDFNDLSKENKIYFSNVVESLPQCAWRLFFEESVCLWNKDKNVYLQATPNKLNYDVERRRVLAIPAPVSNLIPQGAKWVPVRQGGDILFRSRDYPIEFLYYANFEYASEKRFVFSWIKGNNRDNQSAFKIHLLNNDSCYLKSTRYDEYMFVSDVKFEKDAKYSYAFSRKAGSDAGGMMGSAFEWQVKAC